MEGGVPPHGKEVMGGVGYRVQVGDQFPVPGMFHLAVAQEGESGDLPPRRRPVLKAAGKLHDGSLSLSANAQIGSPPLPEALLRAQSGMGPPEQYQRSRGQIPDLRRQLFRRNEH